MELKRRHPAVIVLEALVAGVVVRVGAHEYSIQIGEIFMRHVEDGVRWRDAHVLIESFLYLANHMTEEELSVVVGDMTMKRMAVRKGEEEYKAELRKEFGPGVHSEDFMGDEV